MSTAKPLAASYTSSNQVKLVPGGKPYFDKLEELVDNAKHLIFLQTYIFDEGITGTSVGAALSRAAQRGVKVYVLLDGYASQGLSKEFLQAWREAGVYFRWFEPLMRSRRFYVGRRLHHKLVVVDGRYGLVGGVNVSDRYNDLPGQVAWLDWAVCIEGEAVHTLHSICARRAEYGWIIKRPKPIPLPPGSEPRGTWACPVRIRINDWVLGKMEISRSYREMLRNAQSEVIMMSSYFIPGYELQRQLRLASKRGVTIKVILTGESDVKLAKLGERYLYPWLMRHNVEIYEYQKSILHGKISVSDSEWVTIGSYNLNDLSATASVELNVDISNKPFGKVVHAKLEEIISHHCLRISEKTDKHASPFDRLIQLAAYQMCRFVLFVFTFYFKQHKVNSL